MAAAGALVTVGNAVHLWDEATSLVVALAAPVGEVGAVEDALLHKGVDSGPAAVVEDRDLGHLADGVLLGADLRKIRGRVRGKQKRGDREDLSKGVMGMVGNKKEKVR